MARYVPTWKHSIWKRKNPLVGSNGIFAKLLLSVTCTLIEPLIFMSSIKNTYEKRCLTHKDTKVAICSCLQSTDTDQSTMQTCYRFNELYQKGVSQFGGQVFIGGPVNGTIPIRAHISFAQVFIRFPSPRWDRWTSKLVGIFIYIRVDCFSLLFFCN